MVDAPPVELRPASSALKEARERRGLTQKALAREARVSLEYVEGLEQGTLTNPTLRRLSRIASVLRVRFEELIEPDE